jgi:hypothetical protein
LQQLFFPATANPIAFIGLRVFADVKFPTVIRPDDLALPHHVETGRGGMGVVNDAGGHVYVGFLENWDY